MRRLLLVPVVSALAALVLVPGVVEAAEAAVTLTDRVTPASLSVVTGTRVTFRNQSAEERRVRSEDGPADFDSGNLDSGEMWSVVLNVAGTYHYLDDRHDDDVAFHGTITVGASAPSPPPPSGGGGGGGDWSAPPAPPATRPSPSLTGRSRPRR